MKIVYRAENIFDANLVRDRLLQEGIQAFVNGGMLQGGVGELPASGLVNVTVADEDVEAALRVVEEFQQETAQPADEDEKDWNASDRFSPAWRK